MSIKIEMGDDDMWDIYFEMIDNMLVDGEEAALNELESVSDVELGDDVLIPEMLKEVSLVKHNPVNHDNILNARSQMRKRVYYFFRKIQEPYIMDDVQMQQEAFKADWYFFSRS
jgi:hypothetical protein